jgi:hypothetical protein
LQLNCRRIDDNPIEDARTVLSPIAYSRPMGKWHDSVVAILEELEAGNRDQAKSKWQAVQKKYYDEED